MNRYVTGEIIKKFREREGLTQSQLAEQLFVSNKTISKWENGKGLPDISLLDSLAKALNVSLIELMSGYVVNNSNMSNSMGKTMWYVCPACGNVIHAMGDAVISCCGITLPPLEGEDEDEDHKFSVEIVNDEYIISMDHPMDKDHFLYFIAYRTDKNMQVERLYPDSKALVHFKMLGPGKVFAYCNHHGLFVREI